MPAKKRNRMTEIFIVFLAVMVIGIFIYGNGGEDIELDESLVIDYQILEREEAHHNDVKRYLYHVLVEELASYEELQHTSIKIVEKARDELEFNGFAVSYYDHEEYHGRLDYTLGQAVFAPYGDGGRVAEVETGDYDKMEYFWSLRAKDWDSQLSEEEVSIWAAWFDLRQEINQAITAGEPLDDNLIMEVEGQDFPDNEAITEEVAEQFDITPAEVEEIREKNDVWIFMNLEQ